MPSTRKVDIATNSIKRPQSLRATKCLKASKEVLEMPSTIKVDVATKTIKRPQGSKAAKCLKESKAVLEMPSTIKVDIATKATPKSLKAKKCLKESKTDQMKLQIIGQNQSVVKNPDGTVRTIEKDSPKTPLEQNAVASSPTNKQTAHIIGCQSNKVMLRGPINEFIEIANGDVTFPKVGPALQKIQIVQSEDNKIIVNGLHPNQRLMKLPNGKFQVLNMSALPVTQSILQETAFNASLKLPPNVVQPNQKSNVSPEPLTESQLLEAMSYLIRKDSNFVKKLHEAYLQSFADKASQ